MLKSTALAIAIVVGAEAVAYRAIAGGTGNTGPAAKTHRVVIRNFKFEPATLEIDTGDTVEWSNGDYVDHTATANDGDFDTGPIAGGQTKRIAGFRKGTFVYSCRFHPSMSGTLRVR